MGKSKTNAKESEKDTNHSKDGSTKKVSKKVNTEQKVGGNHGSKLFFIFGVVIVAVAAVIFTNEDVQLFLVKLTPMGSRPLETIMDSQPVISPDSQSSKTSDLKATTEDKDGGKSEKSTNDKKVKKTEYNQNAITSTADFKIRKKLDEADALFEKGDIQGAIQAYDNILKDNSKSPRALWGKGLATDKLAEQKRSNQFLGEAINTLDTALRAPNVPQQLMVKIANKLAERQTFRGWNHKAAQTWEYMMEKYPDNLDYRRKLTVSYLIMGDSSLARDVLRDILAKNPKDGFSLVHLGFILKTVDQNYKEGSELLQRGIDTEDHGTVDGRFYYHLGDAYMRINQTEMSSKVYKKGAALGLFLSEHQRSLYNAETQLTGRPWWTPEQTTYSRFLTILENNWETIRDEGMALLDKKSGGFVPEEENLREKGTWKQYTLYQRGKKSGENCKKAPKTCALLDKIPDAVSCTRGQIKFSVMLPGVHVWPHTGPTNCRLRAHLGLKIPEGPRIRVGDETRTWKEGKFIIIDDSFEHEVWHDGSESRLILIVDFWHPEIPQHERRSLSPI